MHCPHLHLHPLLVTLEALCSSLSGTGAARTWWGGGEAYEPSKGPPGKILPRHPALSVRSLPARGWGGSRDPALSSFHGRPETRLATLGSGPPRPPPRSPVPWNGASTCLALGGGSGSGYWFPRPLFSRQFVHLSSPCLPHPVTQHPASEPGGMAGTGFGLVGPAGSSPALVRVRRWAETAGAERERGQRPSGGGQRCA